MKKRYIGAGFSFLLFFILTILEETKHIQWFDDFIYQAILKLRCVPLDAFFKTITHIGDTLPVIVIIVIALILLKEYKDRLLFGGSTLLTIGLNQILKHILQRPRPPIEERLITQGGYAYPSGHSMVALCIYGILIYFVNQKVKDKKKRIIVTILLSILILLIGISRIYVRVHWPSDVLGGCLLSFTILMGSIEFYDHIRGNKK